MMSDVGAAGLAANGATAGLVKEADTASFQADVIDASQQVPVLVDFWAPWCGPCRQLGPAIEKVVGEQGGKVKLVKINVDENQQLAGQMGIQSIPAVFAFSGGRPVDGFLGALPESEIRRFVDKVLEGGPTEGAGGAEDEIKAALEAAGEALAAGDTARAAQIYELVLQHAPDNDEALLGLARILAESGDADKAQAVLDKVSEDGRKSDAYTSLVGALALKAEAAELGGVSELEARVAADPDDHQARYDLALALNADGFKLEAAEALTQIMKRDRTWNDEAARKKLLELLEAWGPKDPATVKGRRMLSSALFS